MKQYLHDIESEYIRITDELGYSERTKPPVKVAQVIVGKKPSRNSPCPCDSGKKYKLCCINK